MPIMLSSDRKIQEFNSCMIYNGECLKMSFVSFRILSKEGDSTTSEGMNLSMIVRANRVEQSPLSPRLPQEGEEVGLPY